MPETYSAVYYTGLSKQNHPPLNNQGGGFIAMALIAIDAV